MTGVDEPKTLLRGWHRTAAIGALESNLWSMWSVLGAPPGARLIDTDELLAVESQVGRAICNAVVRIRSDAGRADELIDERFDSSRRRRVPLVWMIGPTARPVDLRARLTRRGMDHVHSMSGMIGDITDIRVLGISSPAGIDIVAADPACPQRWLQLMIGGFGGSTDDEGYLRSLFSHAGLGRNTLLWSAVRHGRPMANAVVRLADGVAGVYAATASAEAWGDGSARACIVRALQEARRRGYTTAVVHAPPAAVALYRQVGFTEVAPFDLFAGPGASQPGPSFW